VIQLRHDPTNGPAPHIGDLTPTTVDFRTMPAWPAPGCRRCGNDHRVHVWQVIDHAQTEQGGVVDCATVEKVPA
jgi:hypothetical protein